MSFANFPLSRLRKFNESTSTFRLDGFHSGADDIKQLKKCEAGQMRRSAAYRSDGCVQAVGELVCA